MKKRLLATVLAMCLAMGMLPGMVWAADEEVSEEILEYDGNTVKEPVSVEELLSDSLWVFSGDLTFYRTTTSELAVERCNRSVTSVVIPEQVDGLPVTSIRGSAFQGHKSLMNITIPDSVISIGSRAFCDCSSLASITLPDSLTSIGLNMFLDCSNLMNVTIPDSVTSIGHNAFCGCSRLTSIMIPGSVTSIGMRAFKECSSLMSITIPDRVTSISEESFSKCNVLASITLPDSLVSIGEYAFYGCKSLTSITLPDSLTSIGTEAFYGCSSLTSITLPDGLTSIRRATFSECSSLESITIPVSASSIGCLAFRGCTSLTSITIPNSVTLIEHDAFRDCSSLTDIYYSGSRKQWNSIIIEERNGPITSATIHYNSTGPDGPVPTDRDIIITAMDFGDLTINSSGTATAYFRVTDENGNALPGKTLQYELTGQSGVTTVTTDKNGIFGITTPHLTHSASFWATITSADSNVDIHGKDQFFDVKVKELSYAQEWKGVLNFGGKLGLGIGGGAEAGVDLVDFKLAEVLAKLKTSNGISIKDDYDNGARTLSLNCTNNIGGGFSLSVGPEGTILSDQKITPAAVSSEGMYLNQIENGMKIKNFDPHNKEQLKRVGMFAIVAPVTASRSQFLQNLIKNSNLNICNMQANENSAYMDTGLKFAQVNIGPASGALVAHGDKTTWRFRDSVDHTQNLFTTTKSVSTEVGSGILSDATISFLKKDILTAKWSAGKYLLGDAKSNKKEILATRKLNSSVFDSVSYKVYDGDANNFLNGNWATDEYAVVTFKDDSARWILNNNLDLQNWTTGKNPFISIQNAVDFMYESGKDATVETTTVKKEICESSIPIGLKFAVTAGLNFGVSGEHSYSWKSGAGALHQGYAYKTTTSDVQQNQIESIAPKLEDIVLEAASTVLPDIVKNIASHSGYTTEDIAFGLIKINGEMHDWYAVISTIKSVIAPRSSDPECYTIVSRLSNRSGEDSVILTSTLGEPYNISVYTDETQTSAVTDMELAQFPLTLTLQYTEEMLNKAGADADTDVFLMRFDSEQNLYIREANAVQDKEEMTVTANMTKSGEYILAVDTITTPDPDSTVFGDLNGDGKVTMADVIRLARGAAGYATLTEQEQKAGDVNRDGKITMADVIRVARYAAGYSPAV
ncbi:MAG: leucine-rich repeat protein [Oscillospiraceae bacterium]|nr:leucine-rich repeat protein [Oscillospiraceae bacterium]